MENWNILETGIRERKPLVVFTKSKYIRFNAGFVKKYGLKDKMFVRILTTKKEKLTKIAFIFIKEKKDNALTLTVDESSKGGYISGSSLMTFLNINPRDRKNNKFSPTEEEYQGEKIIVIEIENEEIKSEKETK
jgi:hypothetical protein